jgi:hypothetical protein
MAGLTPEEQHFFESGGDTSQLTPAPAPAGSIDPLDAAGLGNAPAPAPAAAPVDPPAPAPAPAPAADPTELMRTALADAQRNAAALEARLAAATAPAPAQEPAAPDPNTDPLGSMMHQLEQVNKNVQAMQERLNEQQSASQQQAAFQNFQRQVVALRDQFKVTNTDFDAAYAHIREARTADLKSYGVPETDIAAQLFREEVALSEAALKQGKNPAEAIYEMAKRHGYGKPATAAPAPAVKLEAVKKGAAPTSPAALPATPVTENITIESLKDASDADLNKLVTDPAAWSKIAGSSNIPI